MSESDPVARLWALERAQSRDAAAPPAASETERLLIELFDELRSPLLRYLFSLGIPLQDGEEVIQEAFLALFEHLQAGKSRRNLRGWLFRVAHNLGLRRRMHARRETSGASLDHIARTRIAPEQTPEEQFFAAQSRERLEAILDALPDRDRWCLALRAEGLRYREIAEILDASLGWVAESLARSLGRLARATAKDGG